MLQSFREQSGKWFIKVLFGAIIASFMVWGIGDIIRSVGQNRPIAKVGSHSIAYDQYASALQQEISRIQQMIKGRVTPAQLKEIGLYQQVLDQLINQAVLEQELEKSNLSASDSLIRNQIHSMPAFQQDGIFNRQLFQDLLRHNNLRESGFLSNVKQSLLGQQLLAPLVIGMNLPAFYQEILFKALNEKKVFSVVLLPLDKVQLKQNPTQEELKLYYSQKREQYTVPEHRMISLVLIQAKNLLSQIPITEEDIKQEYEKQTAQFTKPEKRAVKSLTYATEEQALQAAKLVNSGKPIEMIPRIHPGGKFDDLGIVEKSALAEVAADVVFKLELDRASEVVNTGFGYLVYQVTKIEPETLQSFNEVRNQIQENLRLQKFGDTLQELRNKIEDSLAGGAKLEEVAKANQLTIEIIPAFDQKGQTATGTAVLTSVPAEVKKQIIEQTFNTDENAQSAVIEADPQTSFVLQVDKIHLSYTPEFEAVKANVEKDLVAEKKHEEAAQLAHTFTQQVKSPAELNRLARQYGLTIKENQAVSRMDLMENQKDKPNELLTTLGAELLSKALQTPLNQANAGIATGIKGFAIIMPYRVEPFKADSQKMKKFGDVLKDLVQKDITDLLLKSFRTHFKVSINQDLIDSMTQDTSS
jgi:peptidyl-prolyl cis-trans isomerase D